MTVTYLKSGVANWPLVDPSKPRWDHQAEELERFGTDKSRGLLWGMRTGKSRVIVDSACALRSGNRIRGGLVFAPNGVHMNWVLKQIPFHSWPGMTWEAQYWSSNFARENPRLWSERFNALLNSSADMRWLTVNSESLIMPKVKKAISDFLDKMQGEVIAIADESVDFRTPGSKRTKAARGLFKKLPYRRILDGTALMNSPLHAFSQFELLEPGALGFRTFEEFKGYHSVWKQQRTKSGRYYPALDHFTNLETLRENIGDYASVVLREDCDDMPELLPIDVPVEMSQAQKDAYLELLEKYLLEFDNGAEIDALEGGKRAIKFHQIVSGFAIDDFGDIQNIDDNPPLMQELRRQVSDTPKYIVWCRFREDIRRVCIALRELGHTIVEYHGGVPQGLRATNVDQFNNDPGTVGFVGQPQAGGRGLELPADTIIWYSSTYDAIIRNQANERGTVMGGRSVSIVTLATPGTVHDDIIASAEGKVRTGDWVSGSGLRDKLKEWKANLSSN